ncbi:hypothetical protein [Nigerium sp.]
MTMDVLVATAPPPLFVDVIHEQCDGGRPDGAGAVDQDAAAAGVRGGSGA